MRSRRLLLFAVAVVSSLAGCDALRVSSMTPAAGRAPLVPHSLGLAIVLIGAPIALVVIVAVLRHALLHLWLARRLAIGAAAVEIHGERVQVVHGQAVALVAGLHRPAIYVSVDVIAALAPDELIAVLRHERHHALTMAPLRLTLLAGPASVFGRFAPLAQVFERRRGRLEIEADAFAVAEGSTRGSIARAILKLSRLEANAAGAAAFAAAADERLHALLGDVVEHERTLGDDLPSAVSIALLLAIACSALLP